MHDGKILKNIGTSIRISKNGYKSEVTNCECEDCSDCTRKIKCTKAKGNKRIQVSKNFIKKRSVSYENILSEEGIFLTVNRSIQVEGAFCVLKNDCNFTRFLTRGITSVKTKAFGYFYC